MLFFIRSVLVAIAQSIVKLSRNLAQPITQAIAQPITQAIIQLIVQAIASQL